MDFNTKIILVDDNPHFRKTIKEFLECEPYIKIIGEAANGKEFLELLKTEQPDIIIMDVFMPVMDGIEASKTHLEEFPYEKIIALTTHIGPVYTKLIQETGLKGCVMKENIYKEIIPAIKTVLNNGYFYEGISSYTSLKI